MELSTVTGSTIKVTCKDCGAEREVRTGGYRPLPERCQSCHRKNVATKSTFNGLRAPK